MIVAVVMVLLAVPVMPQERTVFADPLEKLIYDGDDVKYVKSDLTTTFGMLSPTSGSASYWKTDGTNVYIRIYPSNAAVYAGLCWGSIEDVAEGQTTYDTQLVYQTDDAGNTYYDLELPVSYCGYAHPVAPIKTVGKGGGTTSSQYYLAVPAQDKLDPMSAEPAEPIDVVVTVTNAGAVVVANETIEVEDADEDGAISANDVLIAVHDAKFEGGAAAGYATAEQTTEYGSYVAITKLWGVENGGAYGYYNNNTSLYSLDDEIEEGDHFKAFVYKDASFYSDSYAYFDQFEYEAEGTLTVTLYAAGYDPTDWSIVTEPHAGADIRLFTEDMTEVDASAYEVTDNGDGTYAVNFSEAGEYKLVGTDDDVPLVPAVADVTATAAAERIELAITNNTGMFKAVKAYLEYDGDDIYLVMALSGSSYHELFSGTYEQAVANGDGSADNGNDSWIHGYQNDEEKWEFRIPLEDGQSYIPIVAVSNTYYEKYLNGENSLARAFYPRQAELDAEARTLVVGDFEKTDELTVTNNVKMFKVNKAVLHTVGGPNSNGYASDLILTMGSASFDKAFVGIQTEAEEATEVITIGDDLLCTIPVKWLETFGNPDSLQTLVGQPFTVSFHSVSKDQWYERIFTLDEEALTLVIDDAPKADYSEVDEAIEAAEAIDRELYSEESLAALDEALDAVVRDRYASAQDEVDAMAEAINSALDGLEEKELEYSFDADTPTKWVIGSGKDFSFTVHRSFHDEETFGHYEGIKIDGHELSDEECTAAAGSLKGTVKAAYLETLSEGEHKLTVSFDDADDAELTFNVMKSQAPGTGDTDVRFYIAAVLAFAIAAAWVIENRRYHE